MKTVAEGFMVMVSAIILVALCLTMLWMTQLDGTWPRPFLVHWEGCFATEQKTYQPGDPIRLRVVANKAKDLTGEVSWSLVSDTTKEVLYFLPRNTVLRSGYSDLVVQAGVIPEYATPGRYHMQGYVTYQINPLRVLTYQIQSDAFLIERRSDGS